LAEQGNRDWQQTKGDKKLKRESCGSSTQRTGSTILHLLAARGYARKKTWKRYFSQTNVKYKIKR